MHLITRGVAGTIGSLPSRHVVTMAAMFDFLIPFAGGLGLFLVGMMLMSDGLVGFASGALQRGLIRFTGTPFKAMLSGGLITMLVQSSSATTVTLIGFVSAGLIGFAQAVGVVIGASLGNTATGWIVAGLGLKVNLGFYTLPLVGIGAFMKLLARGRWQALGMAMAGFGLMFLGLDTLQQAMKQIAGLFNLASLPTGGYGARIAVMLIGLAMTAVMQSSTAAIATTLAALHASAINFDQAAALVVGAAIGTTMTGVLSAIGGTIHAKRTALAYVLFNAAAGVIAIALLPLFHRVIDWLGVHAGLDAGASSLAAFHTLFIAVGVIVFLPFAGPFARYVERLLPDGAGLASARLDDTLLALPAVALEASERALEQLADEALAIYDGRLRDQAPDDLADRLRQFDREINRVYDFVGRIEVPADDERLVAPRIAQLHAIDHLLRFRTRLHDLLQVRIELSGADFGWAFEASQRIIDMAKAGLRSHELGSVIDEMELAATGLTAQARQMRQDALRHAPAGQPNVVEALQRTDCFRWIERSAHHIWRMSHYLAQGRVSRQKGRLPPMAHPPLDAEGAG